MERVESEEETFRVVRAVGDLSQPWAVAWLPDGRMLITEKPGRMVLVDEGTKTRLSGLPDIAPRGQGGLLDVRLSPTYEETGRIYLAYSAAGEGGVGTVLARATLEGTSLTNVEELYRQQPFVTSGLHFG